MNAVYLFDVKNYGRVLPTYVIAAVLACLGVFTGTKANLHIGEGIYLNSPYTIGFMLGLLSLSIIFIATITGAQLLFKEWDARFDQLLFTTALSKSKFTAGRFFSFYVLTFSGFLLLTTGFMIGQTMRGGAEIQPGLNLIHYMYPVFLFGCINSLFVCSMLSLIAWTTRNKLLFTVSGLMLYVLYMIVLLFSSSPFMAQSMPQSLSAQYISALADPFGVSAYFFESRSFSVIQRNTLLTPLTGTLLFNRLLVTSISFLFLYLGKSYFTITNTKHKQKRNDKKESEAGLSVTPVTYQTVKSMFRTQEQLRSIVSFLKTDLTYIFKSIPLVISAILLLFFLGMEMYAEIEKGIRLPQKFASSGLMASTILENFHLLGVLLVMYYANDLYWRSSLSRFSMLENVTAFSASKLTGHWLSMTILILFFSILAILLGLVFQLSYHYAHVDITAYFGVIIVNSCPLILLSAFVLLLNQVIPNKYLALGGTLVIIVLTATPFANKLIHTPLLRIFTGFKGSYSDFNGYGSYLQWFEQRLVVGLCLVLLLWQLVNCVRIRKVKRSAFAIMTIFTIILAFSADNVMENYEPENKEEVLEMAANYEKQFRKYQLLPQPIITHVTTNIHLHPSQNRYVIEGEYILKNKTIQLIEKILLHVNSDLKMEKLQYISPRETINATEHISELKLQHALIPNDSAIVRFVLCYSWQPVNGHKSFNSIIENGSFMRISRYYPQIGYQDANELQEEKERKQFGLGTATQLKKIHDPRTPKNDFIQLDMTIDTEEGQIAVGTGDLVKEWRDSGRHFFQYITPEPVPFRFAVSSAVYKVKNVVHDSVRIAVLYHPTHEENVEHLIHNAKLALTYCRENFGPYPFKSLTFAEVSSFTRGFAATAYPATVFMTEDMVFHANIKADEQQDVVNELAGHELSHLWWGCSQVSPDEREGAAMLTETLAMYTEMMLYKKMYGKEEMMKRVDMHQQIYDAEKGFTTNESLYKVIGENTHISYSKGAVVMVKLSELMGEDKVNEALRNFLQQVRKSEVKPVATDVINEIMNVSEGKYHAEIRDMFMKEE